jgi:hypothetical protein
MAATAKSKSAPAKPPRPASYKYSRSGRTSRVVVSRATKPAAAPKATPEPEATPEPAATPSQKPVVGARSSSTISSTKIERSNYQSVILMEYVAAVLLTAATPIATKQGQPGLSPYVAKDLMKIAALTLLYLMLAMLSVGGRGPGRFAAWFGGLILIVDGMFEANNIVKDLGLLSGQAPASGAGATSAAAAAAAQTGVNPTVGAQIAATVSGALASPTTAGTEPVAFTEPNTAATTSPGLTQPGNRFTREGL